MSSATLSFILPAYNESGNLAETVRKTLAVVEAFPEAMNVVIVNDASQDDTGNIADRLAEAHGEIRVLHLERNQGIGGAVLAGAREADGEFVIIAPADSPFEAETIRAFLDASDGGDLVLGYREQRPGYNPLMVLNSRIYHWVTRNLLGLPYRDVNWVQMYRRSLFDDLELKFKGIVVITEIVCEAHRRGLRIVEIPCPMQAREQGTASASRFTVMWRTGRDLLKLVWNERKYKP